MGEMSREKKPKRARIEARSTVEEAEAIRALANSLNMSVTEYILYKALYETNASSGSTLRDIWDELFTISAQLSELNLNAKAIAGQSRAAEARRVSMAIFSAIDTVEPCLIDVCERLSRAIEAEYPTERRRNALS
jgi:hypothetical protein